MKAIADKHEKKYLKQDVSLISINISDANENIKKEELPFDILLKEIS